MGEPREDREHGGGGALNLKSGGSKCKQWHAEQLKGAINREIEQEREQARERERARKLCLRNKNCSRQSGISASLEDFHSKAQSGAIGKSTSLSHLNSVKPCPTQRDNIDACMFARNHPDI